MKKLVILLTTGFILFSCSDRKNNQPNSELELKMNNIAEAYVKLVLKVGQHDADYVDAYYGPEEWKPAPLTHDGNDTLINEQLDEEADKLLNDLDFLIKRGAPRSALLTYPTLFRS